LEQRRRADILITNLRWALTVAALALVDDRQGLATLLPFIAAVAAYNSAVLLVCLKRDVYARLWMPVACVSRLLDIVVITLALPVYLPQGWYFGIGYVFISFGTGMVLRWRWGLVSAGIATLAYAARTYYLLHPTVLVAWPKQVALIAVLCLLAALLGESFSRYQMQEQQCAANLAQLQALQRLGTAWAMEYGPRMVQVLAESALDYIGAATCTVAIAGGETTPVAIVAERVGERTECRPAKAPAQQPSSGPSETTVVASGLDVETFIEGGRQAFRLARPVMVRGMKALLQIEAKGLSQPLGDEDKSAMAILASHMSMVLEQAHTAAVLQHAAQTDAITGILNKRALMSRLAEEVGKGAVSDRPLALLMIDLDGFKNYNDVHGHLAGDALLERVGAVLRSHTRPQDVAGRFGGDEFVLALPGCDAVAASDVARRLLSDIEKIQQDDDPAWRRVTASCGVSVMPQDGNSIDTLVKAADTCLLYAKQLGKKRLFVSGLSLDQDLSWRQPLR